MATSTTVNATNNQLHVSYSREQVFLGELRTIENETLLNATAGELTYPIGTLLGRVTASGKLVPLASGANDGSQYPVGLLAQEVTLAASGEANVCVAIAGNADEDLITLNGSDTLTTTITNNGAKTIKDAIHGDTSGIILIKVRELSQNDNA